jgi:uncharacterized protein (DUF1499 family)
MLAAAACALVACAPERSAVELPTAADVLGLLKQGGGPNVAVTTPTADDLQLRPHTYPGRASEVARRTEQVVATLPRWQVVAGERGVIWLTRRTRLGFVDDIYLLLLPTGDSTVVLARSASRIGRFDLGQNRRNLIELWSALEKGRTPSGAVKPRETSAATFRPAPSAATSCSA